MEIHISLSSRFLQKARTYAVFQAYMKKHEFIKIGLRITLVIFSYKPFDFIN